MYMLFRLETNIDTHCEFLDICECPPSFPFAFGPARLPAGPDRSRLCGGSEKDNFINHAMY